MLPARSKRPTTPPTSLVIALILALATILGWLGSAAASSPPAQTVYGQADLLSGIANRGVISAIGLGREPVGVAVDAAGGVYVADIDNARVLYFPPGATTATRVYGQSSFSGRSFNGGASGPERLGQPSDVAVAEDGVYIADSGNHRVLFFPGSSTTATRVYGQPDFDQGFANNGGISATSLNFPTALAVTDAGLYVADAGNNRVLSFAGSSTTADRVYGQPDFSSSTADNGGVSATSLNQPYGLAADAAGVYISDYLNSRVLYFAGSSTTATRVYGQPDFSSSTSNNDGAGGFGPTTAASLAFPRGLALDGDGRLYVVDAGNSRVLSYPAGATTATGVFGQPDFASAGIGAGAAGLRSPGNVSVESSGRVFISDMLNNRVLSYAPATTTADRVYGQPDFDTVRPNRGVADAGSLNNPYQIALAADGRLYVADFDNARVLSYPPGATTADRVYGQPDFSTTTMNGGGVSATSLGQPSGVAVAADGVYVADPSNNRVLFYPGSSTTATRVYGQPDFSSNTANNDGAGGFGPPSAANLNFPTALAADTSGVYILDQGNNRVLFYPGSSTTADRVYGQPDFTSNTPNNGGVSATSLNRPEGLVADADGVYIADRQNNRVLFYPGSSTTATRVYGQPDFSSSDPDILGSPKHLALSPSGALHVAAGNSRVLAFAAGATTASVVYGQPSLEQSFYSCGTTSADRLCDSYGVAVDGDGTVFVADTFNHRVVTFRDVVIDGLQASSDLISAPTDAAITFSASVSAGTNVSYSWSFSDGQTASGQQVTRSFSATGSYTATVTARNPQGDATAGTSVMITLPPPPPITLLHPGFARASFGNSSTLYASNAGTSDASVSVTFVGGGSPVTDSFTVPAGGSVARAASSFAGLPAGFNGALIISADQPVRSVVITRGAGAGDVTNLSYGQPELSSPLRYVAPISRQGGLQAVTTVLNRGASPANLALSYRAPDGAEVATSSVILPAGAVLNQVADTVAGLPADFSGGVVVTSDQPITAYAGAARANPALRWLRPDALPAALLPPAQAIARALKAVDEGGGPRTTTIYATNTWASATTVDLVFVSATGETVASVSRSIAPGGTAAVSLADLAALPAGQVYGVQATGSPPAALQEVTTYDTPGSFATDADAYRVEHSQDVRLPYVAGAPAGAYTPISVMLAGAASATVTTTFLTPGGSVAATVSSTLAERGWVRIDPRSVAGLPAEFLGSVRVTTSAGFVSVLVDVYEAAAVAPTPTATASATATATATVPVGPTATTIPTPQAEPGDPAQIVLSFVAGAPGSSFVVSGYNFPPDGLVQLTVNGAAVGAAVRADGAGRFTAVLNTAPEAEVGFYVVVASSGGSAQARQTAAEALGVRVYRLTTSGPDAVVRQAPQGGGAPQLGVPAAVPAYSQPPFIHLPLIRR